MEPLPAWLLGHGILLVIFFMPDIQRLGQQNANRKKYELKAENNDIHNGKGVLVVVIEITGAFTGQQ
jgi:hypothetical protein